MTTSRIESLTDGVFAISMTLLILNIEVPEASSRTEFTRAIFNLWPQFFDYMLSFFLLATFWIKHHRQFHLIKRTDEKLLWLNIFSLMFVVLIPLTTSMYGENRNQMGALLFELNILILGLFSLLHWNYATKHHKLLHKELDPKKINSGRIMNLVTPAVSVVAILISFYSPEWSTLPYILIPFIIVKLRKS